MSNKDFNNTADKLPAEDGYYTWDSYFGRIPVIYQKGVWFLKSNKEPLGDNTVKRWR